MLLDHGEQSMNMKKTILSTGPEKMCLSLEHQNPSKTSEKTGYFDCVTVLLHILSTANQETERWLYSALRAMLVLYSALRAMHQQRYGLRLLNFKMANNKVDLGQIRSEKIASVHS